MQSAVKRRFRNLLGVWIYLAPAVILFLYFKYIPIVRGLIMSFQDYQVRGDSSWLGFANFQKVLADPGLKSALLHTLWFTFSVGIISTILGFMLAWTLRHQDRYIRVFRSLLMIPFIATIAGAAQLWKSILSASSAGFVNSLLSIFGLGPFGFFASPAGALGSVIAMGCWRLVPYNMVIFITGLTAINPSLYEAADMDGAAWHHKFRWIVIPCLARTINIIITLAIIRGFRVFAEVWATTGGGPAKSTEVMMTHIYKSGFQLFDYGYAAAGSAVLFLMIFSLTLIKILLEREDVG